MAETRAGLGFSTDRGLDRKTAKLVEKQALRAKKRAGMIESRRFVVIHAGRNAETSKGPNPLRNIPRALATAVKVGALGVLLQRHRQ